MKTQRRHKKGERTEEMRKKAIPLSIAPSLFMICILIICIKLSRGEIYVANFIPPANEVRQDIYFPPKM